MIGRRLGHYDIVDRLGAGGMGEVYRARDTRLGREVALKCLPESVARDPDRLTRFEREARTVASLNHPNIVTLFSIEETDGTRFLTMERIDGDSLDHMITPQGLPLARVLELAAPLADALAAAHEQGIVHRDLKPTNVMVTRDGRVKVLDFGLAKFVTGEEEETAEIPDRDDTRSLLLSLPGHAMGTIPYMAPEQLRGEAVDARTDIFALGIVIYEMAEGRRPFAGRTATELASAILRDPPAPLSGRRGDPLPELRQIIDGCLEKDPRDRFQTMREVQVCLRRAQDDHRTRPAGAHHPGSTPPQETGPSIAVLPFVNMSHLEEQEYFADGLSEELLNVLAKVQGLHVAARTSSFHFKGRTGDVAAIGAQLRVASVLEGSVRWSGQRVRITAQLIQVSNGYHLWSGTYDRHLDDIFAVQDDIAQSVVGELRAALLGGTAGQSSDSAVRAELEAAVRGRGSNTEAYRQYLQGRYYAGRLTRADTENAIRHYRLALDLDADYALAWAGLSQVYSSQAESVWVPVVEGFARSRQAAERALELEPDLPEALVALGRVRTFHDWDWSGAEACFRRAMELAPGDASAVHSAGALAAALGRMDEAIVLGRRAVALDPLSVAAHNALGWRYHRAGRLSEAEDSLNEALQLSPQVIWAHCILGLVRLTQGRLEEALAEFRAETREPLRLLGEAVAWHALGDPGKSDAALAALKSEFGDGWSVQVAEAHGYRGEIDEAFKWLELSEQLRDSGLCEIKTDPLLRSLYDDERWLGVLQRIGLADEPAAGVSENR